MRVTFRPTGRHAEIEPGASIMDAARLCGLLGTELQAPCAGQGVCGRCQVRVLSGALRNQPTTNRLYLACMSYPASDLVVELLPIEQWRHSLMPASLPPINVDPPLRAIPLTMRPPDYNDNMNDADRLLLALKQQGIAQAGLSAGLLADIPGLLRRHNWQCQAWLLSPENLLTNLSAPQQSGLLLAVDLGTTSIWLQLIDARTAAVLGESSCPNPQEGEDVISRMLAAVSANGRLAQQQAVLRAINGLSARLLRQSGFTHNDILMVAIAGNTVMTQLLMGIDCRSLRLAPYVPAARLYPLHNAAQLGLDCHHNAPLMLLPCLSSYVGGDVLAGVLATGLYMAEKPGLFIDLGTNGEVVLGNREWMVAAAASAGPAFEGGGISCGMTYGPGAIYDFRLHDSQPLLSVVGEQSARGICGSGLVAMAATLLVHGIISPDGRLRHEAPGVRQGPEGLEYCLNDELAVTQADLQNFLQAKAAIYAACACLLDSVGLTMADLDNIILAGSFGNSLNLEHAITIGLLPELPARQFSYAGNSSLAGARAILLNRQLRHTAEQLSNRITSLELSQQPGYMDHYTAALFFPHTQGHSLFPLTWQKIYI